MHPDRKTVSFLVLFLSTASLAIFLTSIDARPVLRSVTYHDDFSAGNLDAWQFPYPEDWVIGSEGPLHFLHMLRNREPLAPRRPMQFALLKGVEVGGFTFQARVRREGRSMLMVFNYVDTLHFYYTHLSVDPGTQQPVHNGIFLVDGEPRRRIAAPRQRRCCPTRIGTRSACSATSTQARSKSSLTMNLSRVSPSSTGPCRAARSDSDHSMKRVILPTSTSPPKTPAAIPPKV